MRRVVIVEDHPLMQTALEATLERADGFTVVGTATTGLQAEPLVARTQPDLVLLDLQLPGLDGLSCLALLRERHPEATVVVLSGVEDDEIIERALSGGAAALVKKSISPADLPVLLRQVLQGSVKFATPRIARAVVTKATRQRPVGRGPSRGLRRDRADRPRARGPRDGGPRHAEPRCRREAVPLRPDGQAPPAQGLPEARSGEPHRGVANRVPPRPPRRHGRVALGLIART